MKNTLLANWDNGEAWSFVGLTSHGENIILWNLPSECAGRPATVAQTTSPPMNYAPYIQQIVQNIDRQPQDHFVPYLVNLDSIARSLSVHPLHISLLWTHPGR